MQTATTIVNNCSELDVVKVDDHCSLQTVAKEEQQHQVQIFIIVLLHHFKGTDMITIVYGSNLQPTSLYQREKS
jgi:hypothetical protein